MLTHVLSLALVLPCLFSMPVDGPVVRDFAPAGFYGGHWGIDLAADRGTPVAAAASGVVSFSGDVAGRLSVTIDHGGRVRTSYSYLSAVAVASGDRVSRGEVIGTSGIDRGIEAVHISVRVGNEYVHPRLGTCTVVPQPGLRLTGSGNGPPYPSRRATRHSWRHIRSTPSRPPHRR